MFRCHNSGCNVRNLTNQQQMVDHHMICDRAMILCPVCGIHRRKYAFKEHASYCKPLLILDASSQRICAFVSNQNEFHRINNPNTINKNITSILSSSSCSSLNSISTSKNKRKEFFNTSFDNYEENTNTDQNKLEEKEQREEEILEKEENQILHHSKRKCINPSFPQSSIYTISNCFYFPFLTKVLGKRKYT